MLGIFHEPEILVSLFFPIDPGMVPKPKFSWYFCLILGRNISWSEGWRNETFLKILSCREHRKVLQTMVVVDSDGPESEVFGGYDFDFEDFVFFTETSDFVRDALDFLDFAPLAGACFVLVFFALRTPDFVPIEFSSFPRMSAGMRPFRLTM